VESEFKLNIWILVFTLIVFLGIGTISYHSLEDLTWTDSFYYSVVTLSTVGYGDIHPHTKPGKIFTSFYILVGVGIILSTLSIIGNRYLETERREKEHLKSSLRKIREVLKARHERKKKNHLKQKSKKNKNKS